MGEVQELPPVDSNGLKDEVEKPQENAETNKKPSFLPSDLKKYKWWLQMVVYAFFVLAGQSVGVLLGRLYFNNGGKSEWMGTLVQVVGFPVVIPFQWITTNTNNHIELNHNNKRRFPYILVSFYVCIGIFLAADCMLYTIGIQYLPVTTYTLICASQLGFNALFSYLLNGQKFTPYIVNSLVLLTISSILLVFEPDSGDPNKASKSKYILGFLCTLAASAGYALMLSLTQLTFIKVIKKETLRAIIDMSIYQGLVATFAILIGLFASGDWRKLSGEMEHYKSGQVSYIMNLFWTAVSWQIFSVGCIGLIFKVSSLFSNVISILGLPVAPVLAVILLHDKLTGLKAVSMLLAVWGFVSYMYQHYLDDSKKQKKSCDEQVSEVALVSERG